MLISLIEGTDRGLRVLRSGFSSSGSSGLDELEESELSAEHPCDPALLEGDGGNGVGEWPETMFPTMLDGRLKVRDLISEVEKFGPGA